jgi:hypothetical protein
LLALFALLALGAGVPFGSLCAVVTLGAILALGASVASVAPLSGSPVYAVSAIGTVCAWLSGGATSAGKALFAI